MAMRRNRNRVNATGRNETSRFVRLDYRILTSNAYRSLSPNARSLLVELVMLYNGENNGSLYLSVRHAAHRMGVADLTATSRAFDSLIAHGFIEVTQDAHFRVKAAEASRARCWRLTWLAGPGRKGPSWTFLEPEPGTPSHKRMERGLRALKAFRKDRDLGRLPVLDSGAMPSFKPIERAQAVQDSYTPKQGNGRILPRCRIPDSATHIATPVGGGTSGCSFGWWQPDWTPSITRLAFAATMASTNASTYRKAAT